jgi:protein SCO1/2
VQLQAFQRIHQTLFLSAFAFALLLLASLSFAADVPDELKGASIVEKPGASVLLDDLSFKDEDGQAVPLKKFFNQGNKPVVLALAYYECPNLCTFVLNGITDALKGLDWVPGQQFELVTVSIDHREKPELAKAKKAAYLANLGKPQAAAGWHFLTGDEKSIRKLADSVGFGYKWVEQDQQYAHSAALFAITPDGRVSRTLYGIEYKPKDVKLALLEASGGKIGTVIDRLMLFCYRYNPQTHKYSVYLTQVMQAGGAGTVLIFGGYLAVFWNRQRRSTKKQKEQTSHA